MPTRPRSDLVVLICVAQQDLREQVIRELTEEALKPIPALYQTLAVEDLKLGDVQERLEMLFRESAVRGVVVVSDGLAEEDSPGQLISTPAARELFTLFNQRLYATVALADTPGTVRMWTEWSRSVQLPTDTAIYKYVHSIDKDGQLAADYDILTRVNRDIERTIAKRYTQEQYLEYVQTAGFEILRHDRATYHNAVMLVHARKK
jgi:hypothetical protein